MTVTRASCTECLCNSWKIADHPVCDFKEWVYHCF